MDTTSSTSAIRDYVRTDVSRHGKAQPTIPSGRCPEQGRLEQSLSRAVQNTVGNNVEEVDTASWAMAAVRRIRRRAFANPRPMSATQEETLRFL